MSERRILGFKPALRLEWCRQNGQDETQQYNHYPSIGDSVASSTRDKVFGTHKDLQPPGIAPFTADVETAIQRQKQKIKTMLAA
jgi:hypothetical protein